MDRLPIYIVAGGRSQRFGSDKARALIDGVPMIRRVADALQPIAQSVTAVAATAGAYNDLGIKTIGDLRPGMGPMGGLDAALADRVARHGKGWLLLASCDLTDPRADLARRLIDQAGQHDHAQVIAYRVERWEPLLALYHSTVRSTVRRHLDARKPTMWRLIEQSHPVAVPLPEGVSGITQANTPDDLSGEGG